ncbi:DUF4397 domain-containing protein [Clostridium sp. HMP27]|uniref:DUF4397 domain-containing protein n=1 Tax=Clostridium sp. HMP27 TaxID=1487921 RepID=UPI00052BDAF9|nr:DUF4397 domain-containing protein [Clostridium sp. HMP27]KGK87916.1 hypothetical protein DP68_08200 [Clostridium sp. HMP27]
MLYCPYEMCDPYFYRQEQLQPNSFVRVLHASPNAPMVDIYANDNLIIKRISYQQFTPYFQLPVGRYNIKIYPSGTKTNPVVDTNVNIPANKILTVAAIGQLPNIELYAVSDMATINPSKTLIRFVHLSPNAPNVDIILPNGTKLFENVGYKDTTNYIAINPGIYTVQVRPTGTESIVLTVPNIRLKPNRAYTIYAVGLVGAEPPLQVLIPLDGCSYIGR